MNRKKEFPEEITVEKERRLGNGAQGGKIKNVEAPIKE